MTEHLKGSTILGGLKTGDIDWLLLQLSSRRVPKRPDWCVSARDIDGWRLFNERIDRLVSALEAARRPPVEGLVEALTFIKAFAALRSKDDAKVFARVSRGALRTIEQKAAEALALAEGGGNKDNSSVGISSATPTFPSPSLGSEPATPSDGER